MRVCVEVWGGDIFGKVFRGVGVLDEVKVVVFLGVILLGIVGEDCERRDFFVIFRSRSVFNRCFFVVLVKLSF